MKVNSSELKILLELLAPCLASSNFLPILSMVCFDTKGVYAFNDLVGTDFPWEHGLPPVAVDGKALLSFLSKLKDQELTLDSTTSGKLKITGKGIEASLPTMGPDDFIFKRPAAKGLAATISGVNVLQRLAEAIDVAATSSVSSVYKNVTLGTQKGSSLFAYATDGPALTHARIGSLNEKLDQERTWIVPKLAMEQIIAAGKAGNDPIAINLSLADDALVMDNKDTVVYSKILQGNAPDFVKAVSETPVCTIADWAKDDLLTALETAEVICDSFLSTCHVGIEKQTVTIHARDGKGEFKTTIKVPVDPPDTNFQFSINPAQVIRAFKFKEIAGPLEITNRYLAFGTKAEFLYAVTFSRKT